MFAVLGSHSQVNSKRTNTQMPTVYVPCMVNTQLIFLISRSSCGSPQGTKARLKIREWVNSARFASVHDEVVFGEILGFETTECFVLSIVAHLQVMLPGIKSASQSNVSLHREGLMQHCVVLLQHILAYVYSVAFNCLCVCLKLLPVCEVKHGI